MIGMGAKSITIVRAVTADLFYYCWAAEVLSDERVGPVPWDVHNHAQDLRLETNNIIFTTLLVYCVLLILTSERILAAGGNQRNNVRVELNDSVLNGLRKESSLSDRLSPIAFITKLPIITYNSLCN
jgi:hypothetical protein